MPKTKNEPSKSDFVRNQPAELSATEVLEKAKEAGLSITPALVYKVRAGEKGPAKKKSAGAAATSSGEAVKAKANGKLSASDYIRSLSDSLSAKEVEEKGAAEGYSFKAGLVYAVRRAASKRLKPGKNILADLKPQIGASGHKGHAAYVANSNEFRKLMIRLGLDQAQALFDDVHSELKAIEDNG